MAGWQYNYAAAEVVNYRDLDVSHTGITVNFPMEIGGPSPGGQAADNGATRQIRGTHSTHEPIVRYSEEPLSMKLSAVAPCPAGAQRLHSASWGNGQQALFVITYAHGAGVCVYETMCVCLGSALIRDNRAWHGKACISETSTDQSVC